MTLRRVDFGPGTAVGGDYREVLAAMQQEAAAIARRDCDEAIWIGEHPLTVTLGRSLKSHEQLVAVPEGVPIVEVERGGGATLHNLGQVVVYPLLRLSTRRLSPVTYLRLLEQLIAQALGRDRIVAEAIEGKTGVWVGERKIASIGVAVQQDVTRHGLALNVTNDLADFAQIAPCGFSASMMTRVVELLPTATYADYRERLAVMVDKTFSL